MLNTNDKNIFDRLTALEEENKKLKEVIITQNTKIETINDKLENFQNIFGIFTDDLEEVRSRVRDLESLGIQGEDQEWQDSIITHSLKIDEIQTIISEMRNSQEKVTSIFHNIHAQIQEKFPQNLFLDKNKQQILNEKIKFNKSIGDDNQECNEDIDSEFKKFQEKLMSRMHTVKNQNIDKDSHDNEFGANPKKRVKNYDSFVSQINKQRSRSNTQEISNTNEECDMSF